MEKTPHVLHSGVRKGHICRLFAFSKTDPAKDGNRGAEQRYADADDEYRDRQAFFHKYHLGYQYTSRGTGCKGGRSVLQPAGCFLRQSVL